MSIYSNSKSSLNYNFREIFSRSIYDFDFEGDSPYIIDAGANIGLATLFWKSKYPQCRVVAFEPSTLVFELLTRNITANGIKSVECVNMALSDVDGYTEFTTDELVSGSLIVEKNLIHSYKVRTTKLSHYLNEPVEVLKIDIEGAEMLVMEEVTSHLHFVRRIFVEYHSFVHKEQSLQRLLAILTRCGFRYYIENDTTTNSPFRGFDISLGQDLKLNIWGVRNSLIG